MSNSKKKYPCVILARGGSKGIPKKNLKEVAGKPLLEWTITQALESKLIDSVWVSTDNEEIKDLSNSLGVNVILRPENISADQSTSESGWLHSLNELEKKGLCIDAILAPQCTSPVRESIDFDNALLHFEKKNLDSLFSATELPDFNLWESNIDKKLSSINYDYLNRKRRQDHSKNQYLENGSFYIFKPQTLKQYNNRLGGNIGFYCMDFWKSFQIDNWEDIKFCETIIHNYLKR